MYNFNIATGKQFPSKSVIWLTKSNLPFAGRMPTEIIYRSDCVVSAQPGILGVQWLKNRGAVPRPSWDVDFTADYFIKDENIVIGEYNGYSDVFTLEYGNFQSIREYHSPHLIFKKTDFKIKQCMLEQIHAFIVHNS